MTDGRTTMIDIYEAYGGVVNEDRTEVTLKGNENKPFKIELLVMPVSFETTGGEEPESVTFGVLLNDEHSFSGNGVINVRSYYEQIKLPVSQVKIIKENDQ